MPLETSYTCAARSHKLGTRHDRRHGRPCAYSKMVHLTCPAQVAIALVYPSSSLVCCPP